MLAHTQILAHLDNLAVPAASFGQLGQLAVRLCQVQRTLQPRTVPRRLVLFAGDHGATAAGTTAWPASVTGRLLAAVVRGSAPSSLLARTTDSDLRLVDVGSHSEPLESTLYADRRQQHGTRNMAFEPALSVEQFRYALDVGRDEAQFAARAGYPLVLAGELGVGNECSVACLAMLLSDLSLEQALAGAVEGDASVFARQQLVVTQAVQRARNLWAQNPLMSLASVAGWEIVAIAGFYQEAARLGLTIVLDGYATTVAACMAEYLTPGTARQIIPSQMAAAPGHAGMLALLFGSGEAPVGWGHWQLQWGEGTGALLLLPMLDAAAALVSELASRGDLGLGPRPAPRK